MLNRSCAILLAVVAIGCSGEKPPAPQAKVKMQPSVETPQHQHFWAGVYDPAKQKAEDEMWNRFTAKMNADDSATK
jgi:hypothetical protein